MLPEAPPGAPMLLMGGLRGPCGGRRGREDGTSPETADSPACTHSVNCEAAGLLRDGGPPAVRAVQEVVSTWGRPFKGALRGAASTEGFRVAAGLRRTSAGGIITAAVAARGPAIHHRRFQSLNCLVSSRGPELLLGIPVAPKFFLGAPRCGGTSSCSVFSLHVALQAVGA